jgi:nitrate reductase NapD
MPPETHISSLVVHLRPERQAEASALIAQVPGAEIHGASADGKLVVVLETPSEGDILDHIKLINEMPGVIATSLIYHEIETQAAEEATHA